MLVPSDRSISREMFASLARLLCTRVTLVLVDVAKAMARLRSTLTLCASEAAVVPFTMSRAGGRGKHVGEEGGGGDANTSTHARALLLTLSFSLCVCMCVCVCVYMCVVCACVCVCVCVCVCTCVCVCVCVCVFLFRILSPSFPFDQTGYLRVKRRPEFAGEALVALQRPTALQVAIGAGRRRFWLSS
jgi:hypothetical protein